jgi:hypothetical protein
MSFISGIANSTASTSNANTQADAVTTAAGIQASSADKATQMQWDMFMKNQENLKPWLESGKNALATLNTDMQPGGRFYQTPELPSYGMDAFKADPLYKVMMNQQADILASNRAGAAGGGELGSGQQMVALQAKAGTNAENYYQQGYQNNYTNWTAAVKSQEEDFNRLASMAGVGQTAATQIGTFGTNAANNMSSIATNQGTNAANSAMQLGNIYGQNTINQANNLSSSIGNAFKGYQAYNAYNAGGSGSEGETAANNMSSDMAIMGE